LLHVFVHAKMEQREPPVYHLLLSLNFLLYPLCRRSPTSSSIRVKYLHL
jgi:hypothetical protein